MGKHLDARLRRRPSRGRVSRRRLLQTLGGAALAAPFYGLLRPGARGGGNSRNASQRSGDDSTIGKSP